MTLLKTTYLSVITCAALAACATTPDPAKVCTSEWIGARSDKAISRIENRSASSLKSLKRAGNSFAQGKKPGLLQLLALNNSFNSLKKELTSGTGVKDLRTLASTCNDPQIIRTAMGDLLDRQELPPQLRSFVEQNPIFENLMQEITAGIATTPTGKSAS